MSKCILYELAKKELEKEFPGQRVSRPTTPLWKIFSPSLKNALSVNGVLGYVVTGEEVTLKHMVTAGCIAEDVVPNGHVVVFAHEGTVVDQMILDNLEKENAEIRFIIGCPCKDKSKLQDDL